MTSPFEYNIPKNTNPAFMISIGNETHVKILADGTFIPGPNYKESDVANAFWQSVVRKNPTTLEMEIERLKTVLRMGGYALRVERALAGANEDPVESIANLQTRQDLNEASHWLTSHWSTPTAEDAADLANVIANARRRERHLVVDEAADLLHWQLEPHVRGKAVADILKGFLPFVISMIRSLAVKALGGVAPEHRSVKCKHDMTLRRYDAWVCDLGCVHYESEMFQMAKKKEEEFMRCE